MNERDDRVQTLAGIVGPRSVLTGTDDEACLATARKQCRAAGDCFFFVEATSSPSGLRDAAPLSADLVRNLKAARDPNGTLSPSKVSPKLAQEKWQ